MAKLEFARHELEEFVNGRVWKQLIAMALEESAAHQKVLEVSDPLVEATAMSRAQGFLQGMAWFVDQPAILVEGVEYAQKTQKETIEEEKEDGKGR